MKKSDIVIIVLRVGALWLVVQAVQVGLMLAVTLAGSLQHRSAEQIMVSVVAPAAAFLVQMLMAAVLWFLAPAIARAMVPEPEAPLGPLPEARDGWLELAVQVLGLYTLVGQIPRLVGHLVFMMVINYITCIFRYPCTGAARRDRPPPGSASPANGDRSTRSPRRLRACGRIAGEPISTLSPSG